MTPPSPAEIAALRGRLSRACGKDSTGRPWEHTMLATADLRAALALLDAQAADLARLTAERERAHQGLSWAMQQFQHYAVLHHAKGPDGLAKARANELAAQRCRQALAPAPAAEVAG